ncbi:MAG: DNA recombination protein RmuC [Phycisphaeraceae bacterium]|nr:DNA recombination protein RmuC [Phycisphaeraceae bacterium]
MVEAILIILLAGVAVVLTLQVTLMRRNGRESATVDPAHQALAADDQARRTAEALEPRIDRLSSGLRDSITALRSESGESARAVREELLGVAEQARREHAEGSAAQRKEIVEALERLARTMQTGLDTSRQLTQQKLDEIRESSQRKLDEMRDSNQRKLDEMRGVVEEKLQQALEERIGAAFKGVGERLEEVHRGLGEMRALVGEVGDLKRVLTNVKSRGTWGEAQLAALLSDFLAPDQYDANVAVRPDASERVEFAVRCPGGSDGETVYLPIDSKFPREDYERLLHAREQADAEATTAAGLALERVVRDAAADIARKYIAPPHTVPFAILFVPTEGLYAELMQRPGLADELQRTRNVTIAGPSTLAAILISFRIGFRTLAIQERSDEVRRILGAAKTEFNKFGEVLDAVQRHLTHAQNKLTQTGTRTRQIGRALRQVEALSDSDTAALLPTDAAAASDDEAPEQELRGGDSIAGEVGPRGG